MAQRWMQQKLALARSHGLTRSGANRATGKVYEDRNIGWVDPHAPGEPSKRRRGMIRNVVIGIGGDGTPMIRDMVVDAESGAMVQILKPAAERQRKYEPPVWKRPRGVTR